MDCKTDFNSRKSLLSVYETKSKDLRVKCRNLSFKVRLCVYSCCEANPRDTEVWTVIRELDKLHRYFLDRLSQDLKLRIPTNDHLHHTTNEIGGIKGIKNSQIN